ncbi:MAG TPA: xanthine dehydrogenase family protein molybdopterin-binding subunit [Acidimicrobiia bacterium]|nr:xanthine dehydrogenase family protein molybdopterin-binding subunit [Acidimicrobiia bacterium]
MTTAARFVGQSVRRKEDPRLLAGQGRYADDVSLPGMLHVAFLRSHVAAGTIRSIDTSAAAALPGVRAVYTAADMNDVSGPIHASAGGAPPFGPPLLLLAADDVRFVGDPIAMVVATSRYIAEDACDLIDVDIEPTDAVATVEAALADGAPLVHPELGTNALAQLAMPDPELQEILDNAAHVVTRTFAMARTTNVPMEGRGIVATYDEYGGELRVWPSTQSPGELKAFASRVTGVGEHQVRIEFGDVGGGFGQKMYPTREEAGVVLAAKLLRAPVKWIEDRRENLIAANQARHDVATLTMAVDAEGHFQALVFDLIEGVGSYPPGGGTAAGGMLVMLMMTGPYRIAKTGFSCTTVFTNTCGKAPFRGPWAIETIAREQMVDEVAREIGMDPIELRRRNVIHQSDLPYAMTSGMLYDIVTPEETLEQAVEILDRDAFRAEQATARADGRLLGVGVSGSIEPSAVGMGPYATEQAIVRIDVSGKVEVLMGTGSHGHSLETTIPQVVAEHLGCDIDDVVLRQGGDAPYGPGTGGSRSAVIAGGAAQTAATTLREKIVSVAAHLLEAAPEDLEVADSRVSVRGTPSRALTFAELAGTAYLNAAMMPPGLEAGLEASSRFSPPSPFTWSNATHVCTCEVDPETGVVTLLRYIVSEDCGVMINPMVVEGQIAGGVAQGIGGALYEEMAYDDDGNPLATTFLDYLIPTASEVPVLEYGHVETPSNSLGGYKGMGEGGAIVSPAAVANAVNDALALVGAHVAQFPITPTRVLDAIEVAASRT